MGRRRGPTLTREHADKIVRKLSAEIDTAGRAHDLATVYFEGMPVIQFSIRRSSRKDTGHGHLTEDLRLPAFQVKRLADCPMNYDEWVTRMRTLNVIPQEGGKG
jgi:hypothetical protein